MLTTEMQAADGIHQDWIRCVSTSSMVSLNAYSSGVLVKEILCVGVGFKSALLEPEP